MKQPVSESTLRRPQEILDEAIRRYNNARLDKSGSYVLCGRPSCGTRLAQFMDFARHFARYELQARRLGNDVIAFLPGWAPTTRTCELWKVSSYARRRGERGLKPKLRRYPGLQWKFGIDDDPILTELKELPVAAICPSCGMTNAILPGLVHANFVLPVPAPIKNWVICR